MINLLPIKKYLISFVFGGALIATNASGADIAQMFQQLSPEQQAAILKQQGGASANVTQAPISNPEVVKRSAPGSGPLEADVKSASADEASARSQVLQSSDPSMVADKAVADKEEVRRAFEAYVKESKPMVVDTANLQQFGYELFSGEPSTFAPATDVPVPAEYIVGPGDEIKVQLYGNDSSELSLTVDREGAINFPKLGPIQVAGMSFGDAKALIAEQIKQNYIGATASINMGALRSIRIFALGDVTRPGSYTVSGLATLSHALFVSGGVKKIGSLRNVQLKRSGKLIGGLDLYDFLLKGDTSRDVRLLPGDVVFVPPIGQTVSIAGQVVRPAIYEIKKERTAGDILKLAGGLLPKAYVDKALIERIDGNGETKVINIDMSATGLSTPIKNGDVIKVFAGSEFESNQILAIGNLKRPGKRAYEKGMRVSSIVSNLDDLLPETFLDYGVIEREAPDTREPMLVRFHLDEILRANGKGGEFDIPLQARDKVYIFKRANFRQDPTLSIAGSVQAPGNYEFKRNMKLADLVLAAGGLTRESDMEMAEVFRTDPQTHESKLIKVNLKAAMQGDAQNDVDLQDLDKVVIHSIYERKNKEEVSISGEVHNPGTFPLSAGM